MAYVGVPRTLGQMLAANMQPLMGIFRSWGADVRELPRREFDQALALLKLPSLPGDVDTCFYMFGIGGVGNEMPGTIDFTKLRANISHTGAMLDQQGGVVPGWELLHVQLRRRRPPERTAWAQRDVAVGARRGLRRS